MTKQLDLFDQPNLGYQRAIKALLALDGSSAKERMDRWLERYKGKKDVSLELTAIEFLKRSYVLRALQEDPESALRLWDETLEPIYRRPQNDKTFLAKLRRKFFLRVAETFLKNLEHSSRGDCMLSCLRAGLAEEVINIGKIALKKGAPCPGRTLGYMGDAHVDLGHLKKAEDYYLQALLKGPREIDLFETRWDAVAKLIKEPINVLEDHFECKVSLGEEEYPEWSGAIGLLTGLLKGAVDLEIEGLKRLYHEVLGNHHMASGIRFAYCMILSDQGMERLTHLGIDIVKIRWLMKELHPELFRIYMESRATRADTR